MLSSVEVTTDRGSIKIRARKCCFLLGLILTCMHKHMYKKAKFSEGSVGKWLGHLTQNLEVGD